MTQLLRLVYLHLFILMPTMIDFCVVQEIFQKQSNGTSNIVHVEEIIYPLDQHLLQLKINWKPLESIDSRMNVDVKPIETDYCKGAACYHDGIFSNVTETILPRVPHYVEYNECPIRPGCSYEIRVASTDRTINERIIHEIPECVENICSCSHSNYLPNATISLKILSSKSMEISIMFKSLLKFPEGIYMEFVKISLSKRKIPSLPWGGEHDFVADIVFPIQAFNNTLHKNQSQFLNFTKPLEDLSTIDALTFIVDNRGCHSNKIKNNFIVPNFSNSRSNSNVKPTPEQNMWLFGILIPLGFILIILGGITPIIYRKMRKKQTITQWLGIYHAVSNNVVMTNITMEDNLLYVDKDIIEARQRGEADYLEIPHNTIHLGSEIGKGAFGRVFIARADNLVNRPTKQMVAVKQLKKRPTADELEEFLSEISTMKRVGGHPNIVNLLGCCTIRQPLMMVMEYVGCGDLLQYLRKIRRKHEERSACVSGVGKHSGDSSTSNNMSHSTSSIHSHSLGYAGKYLDLQHSSSNSTLDASYITQLENKNMINNNSQSIADTTYTTLSQDFEGGKTTSNSIEYVLDHKELHNFAIQIARGMKHLEEKQITHRDLAARNILIDENKTLKISDFGLSRSGIYVNTKNKKVPLRWLSIEAIRDNLYSSKSDVWAFGIVLWEIGTLGGFPYPTVGNHELLAYLTSGERLQRPENCSTFLYDVMKDCWSENSEQRPSFKELVQKLEPHNQRIYIDFDEIGPHYVLPPTKELIKPVNI